MILQLAGTSDARELAVKIKEAGYPILTTVVTENAAKEMSRVGIDVQTGRLTSEEIAQLIKEKQFKTIVDASHPFAEEASKNAMKGAQLAGVPYIRYERESQEFKHRKLIKVETYEEAADVAAKKRGNIMLLTGSKTLQTFTEKLLGFTDVRLLARMLPRKDNMEKCEQLGLEQKNIIAMQGPFTKEFNQALLKQYNVTLMITKESGKQGSVDEKVEAALELGVETIVISRPKINYGQAYSSFNEILHKLSEMKRSWENGF